MDDIEKRGLPLWLTAYLNYKLGVVNSIPEELYKEVPNDLKECIDCIAEGKEVPDPSILASYPIYFKEEIIEEAEEHGGSKCETPVASPAGGTYDSTQTVTLTCATDGAIIYYTTDGSEPTSSSIEYTEAITVSLDTTIRAIAIKEDFDDSNVMSANYIITVAKVATPTANPNGGGITVNDSVTLTCATDGATIYYRKDEAYPDDQYAHEYTQPITFDSYDLKNFPIIRARAVKDGMADSDVLTVTFSNSDYDTVAFEELDNYLKNRSVNKPIEITGLTLENLYGTYNGELDHYGEGGLQEGTLKYVLQQNSSKSVDLRPTDILSLTALDGNAIYHVFDSCTSLQYAPAVPNKLYGTFKGCNNVKSVKIEYVNNSATIGTDEEFPFGYVDCIFVDTYAEKEDLCVKLAAAHSDWDSQLYYMVKTLLKDVHPEPVNEVYTVTKYTVQDLLWALPGNTMATPYKLNITHTNVDEWVCYSDCTSPIGLYCDSSRYIDLSPTTMPVGITDFNGGLRQSNNIVTAPPLPNTITTMDFAFESSHIMNVGTIPSLVTSLDYTFGNCSNLTTAPTIPDNITVLDATFSGCTSLVTAPVIHANGETPVKIDGLFENCTSLTTITFDGCNFDDIDDQWSFPFEGCTSLQTIHVNSYADKVILYNFCHSIDSSDSVVTSEKIVHDGPDYIVTDLSGAYDLLCELDYVETTTPYKLSVVDTEPSDWNSEEEYSWSNVASSINTDEPPIYLDLTPTIIPNGTTSLQNAFYGSWIVVKSPIIPNTITNLNSAFNYCSKLAEVTINITDFTNVDLSNIFCDCAELENIYVPSAAAKTSLINKLVEGTDYPEGMDMSEIIKVQSGNIGSTR